MTRDLLIEIGMEEIPARFVRSAADQLKQKFVHWMNEHRLTFSAIQAYATPRRIAVWVKEIPDKQPDLLEEVKGPSRKIAMSEDGEWSKAAQGFARSQGVLMSDLFFKEWKGTEYVYARKSSSGVNTRDLLQEHLQHIITSLSFPKNMRWGSQSLRFIRPIRWLITLYGDEVIPLEIAGVKAGKTSKGHRFLGREVTIEVPERYLSALKEQYVYADIEERKQMIVDQINQLAEAKQWKVAIDEDLLEEVVFLVEYPTVLYGTFNEQFLGIPQEVLITSMREHQRYFPVLDEKGKLLPFFVTVRNGNADNIDEVARGNEKVLRARLSDARFFYNEDLKLAIDQALEKLEKVVYHEELGTIGDKVRRITDISADLSALIQASSTEVEKIKRAAAICKFDLVTQMVYEFPELQGVMGEDYARHAGEEEAVARAVFEHYQPRYAGDDLPKTRIGAIVSIADKIDSIIGCFSIGIVPTGSQDPYALRRQASGIVQIMQAHQLPVTLSQLFETGLSVLKKQRHLQRDENEIYRNLFAFFEIRVRNQLSAYARYDIIDAVVATGVDDIGSMVRKTKILASETKKPNAKSFVDALNRVIHLAEKAETYVCDPKWFEEEAEHKLYEEWKKRTNPYKQLLQNGKEADALELLKGLTSFINEYFDHVMVMVEDEQQRHNRLALLAALAKDFHAFADFSKIVWDK